MGNNKYDLTVSDVDGNTVGYVFQFSSDAQGAGVSSQPVDVPTVTTTSPTQAGGPYDVASAGDYRRLALQSFHSGSAQESYDCEDSSPSKFWESQNVDITEKGILKLGPGTTSYVTSPTTIQGVTGVGLGKVWQAFDPVETTTTSLRYSTDNVTWTPVVFTGTDPTGNVVALTCDGTYMYAAFSGNNGIWKGTVADAWTEYCSDANSGDDAACLAACGGKIYVAKGDGTNAFEWGYVDGSNVYQEMSPADVNNYVTAVAAVTVGQFVYVVSSGGGISRVYSVQKDPSGSDDTNQQVAQFPTGFIAKCAYGYLGTLYVGGYYDAINSTAGVGAIYLLSGSDMSLLTMVGDDEAEDWRVLFLHGYEKHLYFVANGSIWRWSLEHGGYSHVAAVAGGVTPAATITWDVTEAMAAEPTTGWTKTETGTCAESVADGVLTLVSDAATERVYYIRAAADTDMDSATGWTVEFSLPLGWFDCSLDASRREFFYAEDDASKVSLEVSKVLVESTYFYSHAIYSGTSLVADTGYYPVSAAYTLRLTVKDGVAKLFVNATLACTGAIKTAGSTQKYQFGTAANAGTSSETYKFDYVRFTNNGAYDPSAGVSTSSGNLVACQDTLWVSATDVGIYKTNVSENTTGWLTTSRSSSHMQTVGKFYRAIEVTTDQVLAGDQTIKAEWAIDGVWAGGSTLTATTSTATKHSWVINKSGQDIRVKLTLSKTASLGPRVTGMAVKYLLPNMKKHTFLVNCTENVQMKNGQRYDEDASAAIDFLFSHADEYVVLSTEYDSQIGAKIETVDWVDMQRRQRPNNAYQGVLRLTARELE